MTKETRKEALEKTLKEVNLNHLTKQELELVKEFARLCLINYEIIELVK